MDDGSAQSITQDSSAFQQGDRVQVPPEGRVLKMASAPAAAGFRSGTGTVDAVTPGGQARMRMDEGTTQSVVIQGASVQPGERLTIGGDGTVTR